MDLWELFSGIGGIGTELGIVNFLLLSSVGYLLRREWKRIKAKVDPIYDRNVERILKQHDDMWKEHTYRKRRNESGTHHLDDDEVLSSIIGELMTIKEERDKKG